MSENESESESSSDEYDSENTDESDSTSHSNSFENKKEDDKESAANINEKVNDVDPKAKLDEKEVKNNECCYLPVLKEVNNLSIKINEVQDLFKSLLKKIETIKCNEIVVEEPIENSLSITITERLDKQQKIINKILSSGYFLDDVTDVTIEKDSLS